MHQVNEEDPAELNAYIAATAFYLGETQQTIRQMACQGPHFGPWVTIKREFERIHPQWSPQDNTALFQSAQSRQATAMKSKERRENLGCVAIFLLPILIVLIVCALILWN